MPGPGEYIADPTVGIERIEDLPQPRIELRSRNYRRRACPHCGHAASRDRVVQRTLHDLGEPEGRPKQIHLTYSQHHCIPCGKYFPADTEDLAARGAQYTRAVVALAVRLVIEDGLHIGPPRGTSGGTIESSSRSPPSRTGSKRRGKKGAQRVRLEYLDEALAGFSGYIAADELYDGPFCVLSIVDNRTFRRLIYDVLDHAPTHQDIERFLLRFKGELGRRGLSLQGITTDGSNLYPQSLATIFPGVAHQICEFHILADLTKAVLRAVAKTRKRLSGRIPTLKPGRPRSPKAKRDARKKCRLQQRVTDLFDHRHLFVQKALSTVERRTLTRISRGVPELRSLREVMDEVYRLFDRRCRTATALAKLSKLRTRVRRFESIGKTLQKIFSPTLEKALTFLDDSLLPSTSNAVERGNRRHRKMQKSVYSVRTLRSLEHRMALDLLREQTQAPRLATLNALHCARAA